MSEFDLVIVGAGSSGCVLANRLSEDRNLNVLLIEAGGTDKHPYIRVPAASGQAIFNERFNWMYMTEADASRTGVPEMWPAGKALGGGSSINGMMFVRGHKADYDHWAELGATGWTYNDVLPYFKKMETNERGANEYRGDSGPMHASEVRANHRLTDNWLQAAQNAGIERSDDLNGECNEGVDYVQASQRKGVRCNTSSAYLWPAMDRSNLTVWMNSHVVKVNFEGKTANGLSVEKDGEIVDVKARQGVVLCAGSLSTPKIMKLSGIGPEKELSELNIPIVMPMDTVGENLQEHAGVTMGHHVTIPSIGSKSNIVSDTFKNALHGLNFLLRRRGPLTCGVGQAHAFVKTNERYTDPNVQIVMSPFSFVVDEKGPRLYDKPAIGIAVGLTHTQSRGRVSLASSDWRDKPKIEFQMLASQDDVQQLIEGCKIARQITRTSPFKELLKNDRDPDESIQTDEQWEQYVRAAAFPMYHPCGTCAMGSDAQSVVDPTLQVNGVENLWVADASVFPKITAGNINATVIMVAEKAADHIINTLKENKQGAAA